MSSPSKKIRQRHTLGYAFADFIMAMLAWALFYSWRKVSEGSEVLPAITHDPNFFLGILVVPTGWVLLYAIFDHYLDVYRLSRLQTLSRTFFLCFFGVLFLFFALVLDDVVQNYHTYYRSFLVLFGLHFS